MMDTFLDIYDLSLHKTGEELSGDKVKVYQSEDKTIVVLSDGLGSGVKANILATLTSEIIITMLRAGADLKEVIATVIGTLPICKVRKIAYATFTIVEIDHRSGDYKIINFDNPPALYFRRGKATPLATTTEQMLDKDIRLAEGTLARGDFIGLMSDGVVHAGLGVTYNFGWGRPAISQYIEGLFARATYGARPMVQEIIRKTGALYGDTVGDDATFVGIYAREKHKLMVFTGPPIGENMDEVCVNRLLAFDGRKAVCGGTTGTIVAAYLGEAIHADLGSLREDIPPIGHLSQIDLVTEGIITMSKALDHMNACHGDLSRLPLDANGAVLLARELLGADTLFFLVGQKINEFYQNPLLPRNLSIRKYLVEEIAKFLRDHKKVVTVEYC